MLGQFLMTFSPKQIKLNIFDTNTTKQINYNIFLNLFQFMLVNFYTNKHLVYSTRHGTIPNNIIPWLKHTNKYKRNTQYLRTQTYKNLLIFFFIKNKIRNKKKRIRRFFRFTTKRFLVGRDYKPSPERLKKTRERMWKKFLWNRKRYKNKKRFKSFWRRRFRIRKRKWKFLRRKLAKIRKRKIRFKRGNIRYILAYARGFSKYCPKRSIRNLKSSKHLKFQTLKKKKKYSLKLKKLHKRKRLRRAYPLATYANMSVILKIHFAKQMLRAKQFPYSTVSFGRTPKPISKRFFRQKTKLYFNVRARWKNRWHKKKLRLPRLKKPIIRIHKHKWLWKVLKTFKKMFAKWSRKKQIKKTFFYTYPKLRAQHWQIQIRRKLLTRYLATRFLYYQYPKYKRMFILRRRRIIYPPRRFKRNLYKYTQLHSVILVNKNYFLEKTQHISNTNILDLVRFNEVLKTNETAIDFSTLIDKPNLLRTNVYRTTKTLHGGARFCKKLHIEAQKVVTLKQFTQRNTRQFFKNVPSIHSIKKHKLQRLFYFNKQQLYCTPATPSSYFYHLTNFNLVSTLILKKKQRNKWNLINAYENCNTATQFLKKHASKKSYKRLYFAQKHSHNNNNNILTNYFPLYFFSLYKNKTRIDPLSRLKNKLYYRLIAPKASVKYKTFFMFFIIQHLEKFLGRKLWVRVCPKGQTTKLQKTRIRYFWETHGYRYHKFLELIPVRELLEIVVIMCQMRDLQIFLMFIRDLLEEAIFKKHKKILWILFDVLKKNHFFFDEALVKGFSFDIRGKVGSTGNAKKRHFFFSIGKISTTSQQLRSQWQQINVWTHTGQMGITCSLQY